MNDVDVICVMKQLMQYGCATNQLDDDGDGVMNDADACPNTSPGEQLIQMVAQQHKSIRMAMVSRCR